MKITFGNTERPLVYTLNLETTYSPESFRAELDTENWQIEVFKNVGGRRSGGRCTIDGIGRYDSQSSLGLIRGTILKELFSYVLTDEFKQQWISELVKDPVFCKTWTLNNVDDIASFTKLQANYVLDKTMAKVVMHLDNRLLMATGMIYLTDTTDFVQSKQTTIFYTDQNKSDPMVITPKFGTGWIAANTHNSWHEGMNMSGQERYSLLLGLAIDVGRIRKNK
jgi:hypothetical protein